MSDGILSNSGGAYVEIKATKLSQSKDKQQ